MLLEIRSNELHGTEITADAESCLEI